MKDVNRLIARAILLLIITSNIVIVASASELESTTFDVKYEIENCEATVKWKNEDEACFVSMVSPKGETYDTEANNSYSADGRSVIFIPKAIVGTWTVYISGNDVGKVEISLSETTRKVISFAEVVKTQKGYDLYYKTANLNGDISYILSTKEINGSQWYEIKSFEGKGSGIESFSLDEGMLIDGTYVFRLEAKDDEETITADTSGSFSVPSNPEEISKSVPSNMVEEDGGLESILIVIRDYKWFIIGGLLIVLGVIAIDIIVTKSKQKVIVAQNVRVQQRNAADMIKKLEEESKEPKPLNLSLIQDVVKKTVYKFVTAYYTCNMNELPKEQLTEQIYGTTCSAIQNNLMYYSAASINEIKMSEINSQQVSEIGAEESKIRITANFTIVAETYRKKFTQSFVFELMDRGWVMTIVEAETDVTVG